MAEKTDKKILATVNPKLMLNKRLQLAHDRMLLCHAQPNEKEYGDKWHEYLIAGGNRTMIEDGIDNENWKHHKEVSLMAEYTKGKWSVSHPLNDKTTIITPERLLANIEWGTSIPQEEQRANGVLFASAPALYEALKAVQQWRNDPEMFIEEIAPLINKALALVEKGE